MKISNFPFKIYEFYTSVSRRIAAERLFQSIFIGETDRPYGVRKLYWGFQLDQGRVRSRTEYLKIKFHTIKSLQTVSYFFCTQKWV